MAGSSLPVLSGCRDAPTALPQAHPWRGPSVPWPQLWGSWPAPCHPGSHAVGVPSWQPHGGGVLPSAWGPGWLAHAVSPQGCSWPTATGSMCRCSRPGSTSWPAPSVSAPARPEAWAPVTVPSVVSLTLCGFLLFCPLCLFLSWSSLCFFCHQSHSHRSDFCSFFCRVLFLQIPPPVWLSLPCQLFRRWGVPPPPSSALAHRQGCAEHRPWQPHLAGETPQVPPVVPGAKTGLWWAYLWVVTGCPSIRFLRAGSLAGPI